MNVSGPGGAVKEDAEGMTFLLAHLSDLHLGPLDRPGIRDLAGKRLTGWLNWERGRARVHNMDVLDALIADIRARNPDHVAVTGDLGAADERIVSIKDAGFDHGIA